MILQRRLRDDSQWRTVAMFGPADIEVAYSAATMLSSIADVRWRVLGDGDRLLAIFDGARWRTDTGALATGVWWAGPRAADDTAPAPLSEWPHTVPLPRRR